MRSRPSQGFRAPIGAPRPSRAQKSRQRGDVTHLRGDVTLEVTLSFSRKVEASSPVIPSHPGDLDGDDRTTKGPQRKSE